MHNDMRLAMRNPDVAGALLVVLALIALLALLTDPARRERSGVIRDFCRAFKKARLYRFGMAGLLAISATFAVLFALLRVLGIDVTHPGVLCVAPFALVFAIGIVALVSVVLLDVSESYRRSRGELRRRFSKDETPTAGQEKQGAEPAPDEAATAEGPDDSPAGQSGGESN